MKGLLAIFFSLTLLLVACGDDTESVSDTLSDFQADNSSEFECNGDLGSGVGEDPAEIILSQACRDLYSLQQSAEITGFETIDSNDYEATAIVVVRLLSCERSCVSEVNKSYAAFLNPAGKWQVTDTLRDFVETENSKTKRLADLGADLASGITFAVLSAEAETGTALAANFLINIESAALTERQGWSWPEVDVTLPDGQQVTYWLHGGVRDYAGKGEQMITLYEKQSKDHGFLTWDLQEGTVLEVVCIRLAYQEPGMADQIKTDCVPPTGK